MIQNVELYDNRLLTPVEVGILIICLRKERGWTQDTLAGLSSLNIRTIQRVENGEASSFDTRRALASALECQDIDIFNKSFRFPNFQELKNEIERLERETIPLSLEKVITGRQLRKMTEISDAFHFEQLLELSSVADRAFSELQDYLKEYEQCSDLYTAIEKLNVDQDIQRLVERLSVAGYTIGATTRKVIIEASAIKTEKPCILTGLTVIIGSASAFPEKIRIPKRNQMKF